MSVLQSLETILFTVTFVVFTFDNTDITSTTTRSMDLESMLDNQSDSDCDISTTDARTIRKQLESLEGMYSEVWSSFLENIYFNLAFGINCIVHHFFRC